MVDEHDTELYDKLEDVFQLVFNDYSIKLSPSMTSDDVSGWDSISYINLIVSIEQQFEVQFSSSEIGSFRNVGSLIECLKQKGIT